MRVTGCCPKSKKRTKERFPSPFMDLFSVLHWWNIWGAGAQGQGQRRTCCAMPPPPEISHFHELWPTSPEMDSGFCFFGNGSSEGLGSAQGPTRCLGSPQGLGVEPEIPSIRASASPSVYLSGPQTFFFLWLESHLHLGVTGPAYGGLGLLPAVFWGPSLRMLSVCLRPQLWFPFGGRGGRN